MGAGKDIQVEFTQHAANGTSEAKPDKPLRPVKTINPKSVSAAPIVQHEVEIIVPQGHAYLVPIDDAGNEYGAAGFLVNHATYNKVYSKSKHANGNPKFSVKKKL